jgi:hypothetical protein
MIKQTLEQHFNNLELPVSAQLWLYDLWDVVQGMDDWRDNDPVDAKEKEKVIYQVMVALPSNPFFQQHANHLLPLLSNAILKWCGANKLEDNKEDLHKAYMWRAIYYDILLEVVRLVHGYVAAAEVSDYVAKMYGETFNDYKKEFENG